MNCPVCGRPHSVEPTGEKLRWHRVMLMRVDPSVVQDWLKIKRNTMGKNANTLQAGLQRAATLPKGSNERRTLLAALRDLEVDDFGRNLFKLTVWDDDYDALKTAIKTISYILSASGHTVKKTWDQGESISIDGLTSDWQDLKRRAKRFQRDFDVSLTEGPNDTHVRLAASVSKTASVNDIVRFIDRLLSGGKEWEYRFWGTDSEGEQQMFKAYGDGDGLYNASVEDYTSYSGWRGLLWGRTGSGLSDDAKELGQKLKNYRLRDISWDRISSTTRQAYETGENDPAGDGWNPGTVPALGWADGEGSSMPPVRDLQGLEADQAGFNTDHFASLRAAGRSAGIRHAYTLPKGHPLRRKVLAAAKQAAETYERALDSLLSKHSRKLVDSIASDIKKVKESLRGDPPEGGRWVNAVDEIWDTLGLDDLPKRGSEFKARKKLYDAILKFARKEYNDKAQAAVKRRNRSASVPGNLRSLLKGEWVEVHSEPVVAIRFHRGLWGAVMRNGLINSYTNDAKFLYQLKNSMQVPHREAERAWQELRAKV